MYFACTDIFRAGARLMEVINFHLGKTHIFLLNYSPLIKYNNWKRKETNIYFLYQPCADNEQMPSVPHSQTTRSNARANLLVPNNKGRSVSAVSSVWFLSSVAGLFRPCGPFVVGPFRNSVGCGIVGLFHPNMHRTHQVALLAWASRTGTTSAHLLSYSNPDISNLI
jgi:hypothetical protein